MRGKEKNSKTRRCCQMKIKKAAPIGTACVCGLAAAAVVVAAAVVAAAQRVVAAAAEEQQDQNDDPPAATVTPRTVVTHNHYLRQDLLRPSPYIPCYSGVMKRCERN